MDDVKLRDEIMADPANMGYAQHVADGNDGVIAELLSQVRPITDPSAQKLPLGSFEARDAAALIDPAEFQALSVAEQNYLIFVAAAAGGGSVPLFDPTDPTGQTPSPFFAWVATRFAASSKTGAKLAAVRERAASRAEVVVGQPSVTAADVARALRGTV